MKLAVMQPYFLPYLGYFDLLNIVDEWIVFDTAQYTKEGWLTRNRVLRPDVGWQYIILPVKKHQAFRAINQIQVSDQDWTGLILRQLVHYRREAPHYREVISFLKGCFSDLSNNLAQVNTTLLRKVAHRLGIDTPIHVLSEMDLSLPGPIESPGDWGWAIAQAIGASEFINRPGGAAFIDETGYRERGIKLIYQSFTSMTYYCGTHQFEPDMSIVDVMMWNSPERIKTYLDTWRLSSAQGGA